MVAWKFRREITRLSATIKTLPVDARQLLILLILFFAPVVVHDKDEDKDDIDNADEEEVTDDCRQHPRDIRCLRNKTADDRTKETMFTLLPVQMRNGIVCLFQISEWPCDLVVALALQ